MAGAFDHAQAGLREVHAHLTGEAGEFLVMFSRHQVDRAAEFLEARPEGGQGARADVVETERQAFGVVAMATLQDRPQSFLRQAH